MCSRHSSEHFLKKRPCKDYKAEYNRGSLNHIWPLAERHHCICWLYHHKSLWQLISVASFTCEYSGHSLKAGSIHGPVYSPLALLWAHRFLWYICWLTAYWKTLNGGLNYFMHSSPYGSICITFIHRRVQYEHIFSLPIFYLLFSRHTAPLAYRMGVIAWCSIYLLHFGLNSIITLREE